jgi:asparagine synthase (glutamine-hydrolysing)
LIVGNQFEPSAQSGPQTWLRSERWTEDLLSNDSPKRQCLFNVGAVRAKLKEHLSGARKWQYLLWDVLIFQNWLIAQPKMKLSEMF